MEQESRRRKRAKHLRTASLAEFVPSISPTCTQPNHLRRLVDILERASRGEPVRALISTPPQHGKSTTIEHAIARVLLLRPSTFCAYATYSIDKAHVESRNIRDYALRAGVKLRGDSKALGYWRTPEGGGLLATGVGAGMTGYPGLKLIVVDDPIKNREEAESTVIRDSVHGWYTSAVISRAHPDTSIIVVATRWHHDDLIGRLEKDTYQDRPVYEVVNLPAINDGTDPDRELGAALWPEARPVGFLRKTEAEVGPYDWSALYMGRPVPRGGAVFGVETTYDKLPESGLRYGAGLDFAYTEKTTSDWSVVVLLARLVAHKREDDRYFVVDVRRAQKPPPLFHTQEITAVKTAHPSARFMAYLATSEMGSGQFVRSLGTPITLRQAKADKFVRAQPVAAAWNRGAVMVPTRALWLGAFLDEVQKFTGVSDAHDDMVDALAAAFDLLSAGGDGSGMVRRGVALEEQSAGY